MESGKKGVSSHYCQPLEGLSVSENNHCKVEKKAKLHKLTKPFQRHGVIPQASGTIEQIPSEDEDFSLLGL